MHCYGLVQKSSNDLIGSGSRDLILDDRNRTSHTWLTTIFGEYLHERPPPPPLLFFLSKKWNPTTQLQQVLVLYNDRLQSNSCVLIDVFLLNNAVSKF